MTAHQLALMLPPLAAAAGSMIVWAGRGNPWRPVWLAAGWAAEQLYRLTEHAYGKMKPR